MAILFWFCVLVVIVLSNNVIFYTHILYSRVNQHQPNPDQSHICDVFTVWTEYEFETADTDLCLSLSGSVQSRRPSAPGFYLKTDDLTPRVYSTLTRFRWKLGRLNLSFCQEPEPGLSVLISCDSFNILIYSNRTHFHEIMSSAVCGEYAYSHLIIQRFQRKPTFIIRYFHRGPAAKAYIIQMLPDEMWEAKQKVYSKVDRDVFCSDAQLVNISRGRAENEAVDTKPGLSCELEANEEEMKVWRTGMNICFSGGALAFNNRHLSIVNSLYLWRLFRCAVRRDVLLWNDGKSFRFCHYSHGPRPWTAVLSLSGLWKLITLISARHWTITSLSRFFVQMMCLHEGCFSYMFVICWRRLDVIVIAQLYSPVMSPLSPSEL